MSFSNIQSVTKTADASAVVGRSRLTGLYFTHSATGASFVLRDGTSSGGTAMLTIVTPAVAGGTNVTIPDMGILFQTGIYIDVSGVEVTSVTLLFEGGAAV